MPTQQNVTDLLGWLHLGCSAYLHKRVHTAPVATLTVSSIFTTYLRHCPAWPYSRIWFESQHVYLWLVHQARSSSPGSDGSHSYEWARKMCIPTAKETPEWRSLGSNASIVHTRSTDWHRGAGSRRAV